MKILVTGHRGYIGSHIYKHLEDLECDVTGIDIKEGRDLAHCLPAEDFDYIFHLAALPSVQFSVENPSYTMRHNVLNTSILLEWARKHGVTRVIFSSSAAAADIQSPYGLHKRLSEMECKLYSELYNIETVCLRYFNVYSEDQPFGGAYSTAISAWMESSRNGDPMRINGDGEQTRDFIHVSDIVSANLFCMQSTYKFCGEVMNIGTGKSVSLNNIKDFLERRGFLNWKRYPSRQGDVRHSESNVSAMRHLGWQAKVDITEGLERCFK